MGYKTELRSENQGEVDPDTSIYLGDTMGELPLLIASGDVAFIGGSLVPVGGHNLLEACAVGVPVVFGEHMFNFSEISEMVLKQGAGLQIFNAEELASVIEKLVEDPVSRDQYGSQGIKLVEQNRGALKKVDALIDKVLHNN